MVDQLFTRFGSLGVAALVAGSIGLTEARADPQSFPLYCQGPMKVNFGAPPTNRESSDNWFRFIWAPTSAGQAPPPPGNCAWADRVPRGAELEGEAPSGARTALVVGTGLMAFPVNYDSGPPIFVKFCVFGEDNPNYLRAKQGLEDGNVHPPFSPIPNGCP